jgi:hypothetical protein
MAMLRRGARRQDARGGRSSSAAPGRAAWTILLALTILLGGPLLGTDRLATFPELMVTELIAIVFIAEYMDVRLLEELAVAPVALVSRGAQAWHAPRAKIAVVRNHDSNGFIGRLGPQAPRRYRKRSVQRPVDALRGQGFEVKVLEGDMTLLKELASYLPPEPRRGYTGWPLVPQPRDRSCRARGARSRSRDARDGGDRLHRARARRAGAHGGPAHAVERPRTGVAHRSLVPGDLRGRGCPSTSMFPLAVRARYEPDGGRIVVRKARGLSAAVREIRRNVRAARRRGGGRSGPAHPRRALRETRRSSACPSSSRPPRPRRGSARRPSTRRR